MTQPSRTALLIVHIAASTGVVGAAGVLLSLGVAGVRGADPRTVYPAAYLVEWSVIAPLALVALGTGLAQALLVRGTLRQRWALTKLVITTGLTIVVFTVLAPGLATLADAAETATPVTDAQRLPVVLAPSIALALLTVNVILGVTKPRLRTRQPSRTPAD